MRPAPSSAIVATLACLFVACETAPRLPEPPDPDTTGFQIPVKRKIAGAREQVLAHPESAEAWGHLGKVLAAHNVMEQALVCYRKAEALDPQDFRWPYFLAVSSFEESHEKILSYLRRAQALNPNSPPINIRMADLLFLHGKIDEAAEYYELAYREDPGDSHALLGLGRVALARGDYEQARRHLERATEHRQDHREVWVTLAQVYNRLGMPGVAREAAQRSEQYKVNTRIRDPHMREVFAELSTARELVEQARRHLRESEFEEAIEKLRMALEEDPNMPQAHLDLGRALVLTWRDDEGIPHLEEASRLEPGTLNVVKELEKLHHRRGPEPAST